jgi:peroxiredoxin
MRTSRPIKLKKLYNKEYMGVDRSTFLIDKNGVLRRGTRCLIAAVPT